MFVKPLSKKVTTGEIVVCIDSEKDVIWFLLYFPHFGFYA